MTRFALTSALVLAAATPALANDQLALSLGLEPGVYTTAELATIKGLRDSGTYDDLRAANVLVDRFGSGIVSTQSVGTTTGKEQLAAFFGVDPADYTVAELAVMKGDFEP